MNAQQKKYLNCLNEVYNLTKDGYVHISLNNVVKEHKVSNRLPRIIGENFVNIIQNGRQYDYKWKSIKPNLKMVNKCIVECSKLNRGSMSKSVINYNSAHDIAKKQTQIKNVETKVVEPKQENTLQIQVYEIIIKTLNDDLDSKEKQIEELEKKLSLKTKRITKKVEPTQKNINILWGLIKIKY